MPKSGGITVTKVDKWAVWRHCEPRRPVSSRRVLSEVSFLLPHNGAVKCRLGQLLVVVGMVQEDITT